MDDNDSAAAQLLVDPSSMLDTDIPTTESGLSKCSVESSVTEYDSAFSESFIATDTSHFSSSTSFSSTEEQHEKENCHEAFLTPEQSSAITVSVPELAAECCGQSSSALGQRSECRVFQVKLVCGLLGLGLTLGNDDLKEVVIKKIGILSSAALQGELG